MNHYIKLTYDFLDMITIHPAKAHEFYQENKYAVDLVLDAWKKHYEELRKISNTELFLKTLEEKLVI